MRRVGKKMYRDLPADFDALVRMHPPSAIHDEIAYENAQEIIDALTSLPRPSKGQLRYLDTLSILFSAYEEKTHAIDTGDLSPIDLVKFLMEQQDMTASDLGRLLGERSLGPKVLNHDRELSKSHIRILSHHFGVSADLLL